MYRVFTATLLVSASAIAYEILLMRILTIVQWHHFAWMIISLALLGYGASGTAIALGRKWLEPRFEAGFSVSALLFSITMIASLVLAQRVPFNALEIVWNPQQFLYLAAIYLLFMLPFFLAANCIGLALLCRRKLVEKIYFTDLLGAGLGALLLIGLLFLLRPLQASILLAFLALAASVVMARGVPSRRLLTTAQSAWALLLSILVLVPGWYGLRISEFKGLSQALQVVDSRVLAESSSPLGLLSVVESPRVPFRHAPGLSFNTPHLPPDQLAVFTDGDSVSVITRYDGEPEALAWLGDTTAALPYQLLENPRVIILGAGAGSDVLLALYRDASRIDAVELNPGMTEMAGGRFRDFAGPVFDDPRVATHIGEARGFMAASAERYDLVQIGLLDSFGASGAGIQALNENYLYTVEAIGAYLGARHYPVAESSAQGQPETGGDGHRGPAPVRYCRTRNPDCSRQKLEHRDTAGPKCGFYRERNFQPEGFRADQVFRHGLVSGDERGGGEPLQPVGRTMALRRTARAARS
jgi:hypothetical protein